MHAQQSGLCLLFFAVVLDSFSRNVGISLSGVSVMPQIAENLPCTLR
jgi:hypothetical protein